MARATFVKKARKSIKGTEIKKGDSYYWWKFRYGDKHYSKTPPKPSQLTQSEFYSTLYSIQEGLEGEFAADDVTSAAEEIRSLGSDCADKASNMESAFQGGSPTIDLLNERSEACESLADELESLAADIESAESGLEEAQSKLSEAEAAVEEAEAALDEAKSEKAREKKQAALDEAVEEKELAETAVEEAEAALESARDEVSNANWGIE